MEFKKEYIYLIFRKELIILLAIIVIIITIKILIKIYSQKTTYIQKDLKTSHKEKYCFKDIPKLIEKQKKYPYKNKKYIMTNAELSFYHHLKNLLLDEHIIFTQVRMEDIIFVPKGIKNEFGLRNKIKSKHIDFVICDAQTGKIQRAIELNDSSHNRSDRKKRDEFVNEAFESAGVTLLTMKTQKSYTRKDIENLFYS